MNLLRGRRRRLSASWLGSKGHVEAVQTILTGRKQDKGLWRDACGARDGPLTGD